jgi:hypothetical protein
VEPKLVPVIVTDDTMAPVDGDRVVMPGATVKSLPALAVPLTVTTTFPVVAPVGTTATIEVAPQLEIVVAVVPLNLTVLVPCVEPKPLPAIVTELPIAPVEGVRLVILGAAKAKMAVDTERKKAKNRDVRTIQGRMGLPPMPLSENRRKQERAKCSNLSFRE